MTILSDQEITEIRKDLSEILDRSLTILQKTVVKDKLGKATETWTPLLENLPCMVEPVQSAGYQNGGVDQRGVYSAVLYQVKFTLGTWYADIKETCRVSFEGKTYQIQSIPRQPVTIFTELICNEVTVV